MRNAGPQGYINEKTYQSESAMTAGYVATAGIADGNCTAVTATGQTPLGIVSDGVAAAGYGCAVTRGGDCPAIAGAAIPYGSDVMSDAVGRLIPWTAGNKIVGRAENTATGLGDQFICYVNVT